MKRLLSGFLGLLAALALALPMSADAAQQIFACVNNSSGTIHVVAQGSSCQGNEMLLTWNVAGPAGQQGPAGPAGPTGATGAQGPAGGILAGSSSFCFYGPGAGNFVVFSPTNNVGNGINLTGVAFGTGIDTTNNGTFTSIVLQPGIYQVHLSVDQVSASAVLFLNLNNTTVNLWTTGGMDHTSISGDALLQVSIANSVLQIAPNNPTSFAGFCKFDILRLQ